LEQSVRKFSGFRSGVELEENLQVSSRMIVRGFVINARRAGKMLAIVTTPANASGAASHTHKAGEPLPGVIPLIHRDNTRDVSIPASVPAQASFTPSRTT
jgi:hypothetical protein